MMNAVIEFDRGEKLICNECKGDNVTVGATMKWNKAIQDWEILDIDLDSVGFCHTCEGDSHLKWIDITETLELETGDT